MSTPRARRSRARPTPPSSGTGRRAAPELSAACRRGRGTAHFFRFPERQSSNRYQHRRSIG
jgi:hypothetical protein